MTNLKVGDLLWHPCSVDIIEHKITSIRMYEGFNHYMVKAVHNVGACGKVEVVLDEHNGKLRFVELLNEEDLPYSSGVKDFVEGNYYTTKEEAQLEFYELQRLIAWSNMEEKERLFKEAKMRYDQIELLIKNLKSSIT